MHGAALGCQCCEGACLFSLKKLLPLLLQNVLWQLDDYLQSSKKAPADTSFRVEVGHMELLNVHSRPTQVSR